MSADDVTSDLELMRSAFGELKDELKDVIKTLDGPKSTKRLVETSSQLRATSERFDALTRTLIGLQEKFQL